MEATAYKFRSFAHMLETIKGISDNWKTRVNSHHGKIDMAKELQIYKDEISRELFFICKKCAGPLIQYTSCCLCKKTASRRCVKCNSIRIEGDHRQCLRIMFIKLEKKTKS